VSNIRGIDDTVAVEDAQFGVGTFVDPRKNEEYSDDVCSKDTEIIHSEGDSTVPSPPRPRRSSFRWSLESLLGIKKDKDKDKDKGKDKEKNKDKDKEKNKDEDKNRDKNEDRDIDKEEEKDMDIDEDKDKALISPNQF
jgi:hypothetical protein